MIFLYYYYLCIIILLLLLFFVMIISMITSKCHHQSFYLTGLLTPWYPLCAVNVCYMFNLLSQWWVNSLTKYGTYLNALVSSCLLFLSHHPSLFVWLSFLVIFVETARGQEALEPLGDSLKNSVWLPEWHWGSALWRNVSKKPPFVRINVVVRYFHIGYLTYSI